MTGDETPDRAAAAGSSLAARLSGFPKISKLYARYEKYIPIATFSAGFLWDALTLTRVDRLSDNLVLLAYLTALAIMIVMTLRRQGGQIRVARIRGLEPHFHWMMQFLLGGLLSSYVVYYFKSVSWTQTRVFFIMLLVLFIGNEFLQQRLGNPKLLASLFFFCLSSFLIFILPILLADIATWIFLLAGVLSLSVSLGVFVLALPANGEDRAKRFRPVAACLIAEYALLNLLYFANFIPPVPLSLKAAGIYHKVERTAAGYEVQYVSLPFYRFWKQWDDPFYAAEGESAFCYTAIFAPRRIRVPVSHVWSWYNPASGWTVTDRIAFEISGGREGGYRGYTNKRRLRPGNWRVGVETVRGQILGRIDFRVVESPESRPPMRNKLIL